MGHRRIYQLLQRPQTIVGWTAVGLSMLAACFWAAWGILETFHEGWFGYSLWQNLAMLPHYLLLMSVFMTAALISIRWPKIGSVIHIAAAVAATWFFWAAGPAVIGPFIAGPLLLMAAGYWFGNPEPRRRAAELVIGLPLLTVIFCGAEPAYRVSQRIDDGNLSARRIAGNGVDLVWAPAGPGWPRDGVTWETARQHCRHLAEDGLTLMESPQDIWRLPTVEEAVRSMHRHGQNSGGTWDAEHHRALYQWSPDKESPLWDVHSPVIYWWTATEVNEREALIIVYDGKAWPRPKLFRMSSLAFRAVRDKIEGE